jgi:hypothetical protein
LAALGLTRACKGLTCNDHIAFVQITLDDFGGYTVSETYLDPSRLRFTILAKHPD